MITTIKNIIKKPDKIHKNKFYYVIYFDYFGKLAYTYLNEISLKYWKNKGKKSLKIGGLINVVQIKNSKFYKIIDFVGDL